MPSEVKQRKKPQKPDDETETTQANGQEKESKVKTSAGGERKSAYFDLKSISCVLSLTVCAALSWVVLQQNQRFSELEEKFNHLHFKSAPLISMEDELQTVSKKCESVQQKLMSLWAQKGAQAELKGLEVEVIQLKDWASGLTEKRTLLQTSMDTLREAVGHIGERTSAISKDFMSKVASVRTDVRRMDGLRSELDSLLSLVGNLEDKASQVERTMVKRIGDVLANSIDRVSSLRSSCERNSKTIEQLQRRIPELVAADKGLSGRLLELESGRAKVIRTVTFASDLKPKIFSIKKDFGAIEPQLSDLTLRIGQLAEDLTSREQEIEELRQTLENLKGVE